MSFDADYDLAVGPGRDSLPPEPILSAQLEDEVDAEMERYARQHTQPAPVITLRRPVTNEEAARMAFGSVR